MSYLKKNSIKLIILSVALIAILFLTFVWGNSYIKKKLPIKYQQIVEEASQKYNIDKYFIYAVISTESSFREDIESHAGAKGLMQVLPSTAEWLNEKYKLNLDEENLFDPKTNIEFGCCYLSFLIQKFEVLKTACAAYNAGQGNVDEWLNKYSDDGKNLNYIPFKETEKYVKRVMTRYEIYKDLYN